MTIVASRTSSQPRWAQLQRELFTAGARAAQKMGQTYADEHGGFRYVGTMGGGNDDRDGVDDFYESCSTWGQFYLMGADRSVLDQAKWHWEGMTRQLTGMGMLADEYERGYDWFHQGESFEMFGFLCAADPTDPAFRERAQRFAQLYTDPRHRNFDPEHEIITSPHNGAEGPKYGFTGGEPHFPWSEVFILYGLPLDWVGVPDIETAFRDREAGLLLGKHMWERMSLGDTAINLAATSLVLNGTLLGLDGGQQWVDRYTRRWARTVTPEGILPDQIGLDGQVGQYLEGRWYGAHYGWSWPHGLHSVGTALLVAAQNQAVLGGENPLLDIARTTLDQVIAQRRTMLPSDSDGSMNHRWTMKWDDPTQPSVMVPYRHSDSGWHDWMPMQTALPVALWHLTGDPADLERLRILEAESSYDWARWFDFKDKEDAGHEEPWLVFLRGENPDYPERALEFALAECHRREALMTPRDAEGITDFNHWQRRNPISTEALVQLTLGAPQTLYNGGLLQARVRWFDPQAQRPGLPDQVAALVRTIDFDHTVVELHNLADQERRVILQTGAMGEHELTSIAMDGGTPSAATGNQVEIRLPARTMVDVTVTMTPRQYPPSYDAPWDRQVLSQHTGRTT